MMNPNGSNALENNDIIKSYLDDQMEPSHSASKIFFSHIFMVPIIFNFDLIIMKNIKSNFQPFHHISNNGPTISQIEQTNLQFCCSESRRNLTRMFVTWSFYYTICLEIQVKCLINQLQILQESLNFFKFIMILFL